MRILVTTVTMEPVGGVETSTLQVSKALAARGHELTLLYRDDGALGDQWRAIAETVQVGDFGWSKRHPVAHSRRLWPTVAVAARVRPHVIWLNRPEHLVWGISAARAARAPLVTHLHHQPDYPGIGLLGRAVTKFIAVSAYMKQRWTQAGLRPHWVEVVHNGVDPADYPAGGLRERAVARARLDLPQDAFVALAYGRAEPDKGTDVLVDAWRRLALPPERARLVVTSQPNSADSHGIYLARTRARAPAGCHWLPMTRDVVPLLHAADVVVLPSRVQEAFGRVVIEGMVTGRPVVASMVGGVPEILTGAWAKLLVEPGDPAALAARLGQLQRWRRTDPDLGQRAVRHVCTHFSLNGSARRIDDILRAAASRAQARVSAEFGPSDRGGRSEVCPS